MKAVMYGGGNIGRGFIGALLSESGYKVTFIDVAEPLVNALKEKGQYPVRYLKGDVQEDVWITNVTAVNGNHTEEATAAIAECDLMATAVGARILKFIVPNIVAGLRRRWNEGRGPLNIIICENLMDANKILEDMIKEKLTQEERVLFDEQVGLVEASIGRMVPVQTDEMKDGEPLRVCVEPYDYLPVDQEAFKGEIPSVKHLVPYRPFDFYIKRKLYIHNMGHAACAYLGDLMGLNYISEAISVPEIRIIVQNAMTESAMALSKKYGVSLDGILFHITDLLHRFANTALKDTCARVGGDPARKLSFDDRLIGSARTALEQGIIPSYITVGTAAGLYRYICETGNLEQGIMQAEIILKDISGLDTDNILTRMILSDYRRILNGAAVSELCRSADEGKSRTLGKVI